jgi:ABC-2 type transport system permease protein
MVIPAGPQRYFLAQNFGAAAYYAIFGLAGAGACVLLFRLDLALSGKPLRILCALAMEGLGLVFMASYQYFVGILAFKFQDMGFFFHVQDNIIAFASGLFIPLSLLPGAVVGVLRFLPFYYVNYLPVVLITGSGGDNEGALGLIIISLWTIFMLITSRAMYQHLRSSYDGVGI